MSLLVKVPRILALIDALLGGSPSKNDWRDARKPMKEACEFLRDEMRKRVPQDTKELHGAIDFRIDSKSGRLMGIIGPGAKGDLPEHAFVVEVGRGPGLTPPPYTPIAEWASRKGIEATAVPRIIQAIGFRGLPREELPGPPVYVEPAVRDNEKKVLSMFDGVPGEIVISIVKEYR